MNFTFPAIGIAHSCFKEKFGIPRQPGLAPLATADIEMFAPYNEPNAFEGLEGTSHLWLQFVFHANSRNEWKPKVKPPRLGGNKSLGVFATRSPTRPAPIGLSVVKFEGIQMRDGKLFVCVSGVDILDGTPILDIKPYVPYVDHVAAATNSFAPMAPTLIAVNFTPDALQFCSDYQQQTGVDAKNLITQILQQDPRPQYQNPEPNRVYAMRLLNFDVKWRYTQIENTYSIQLCFIEQLAI